MSEVLNTPTNGRDVYTQGVTLDGVRYRITLRWNGRTSSWYMDLLDADENPIAVGRRLSPGMAPIPAGIEGGPRGTFYVDGKLDPYGREDLGESLNLIYVSESEIAAVAELDAEEIVVVLA